MQKERACFFFFSNHYLYTFQNRLKHTEMLQEQRTFFPSELFECKLTQCPMGPTQFSVSSLQIRTFSYLKPLTSESYH